MRGNAANSNKTVGIIDDRLQNGNIKTLYFSAAHLSAADSVKGNSARDRNKPGGSVRRLPLAACRIAVPFCISGNDLAHSKAGLVKPNDLCATLHLFQFFFCFKMVTCKPVAFYFTETSLEHNGFVESYQFY